MSERAGRARAARRIVRPVRFQLGEDRLGYDDLSGSHLQHLQQVNPG
jgi:hypothetical protein